MFLSVWVLSVHTVSAQKADSFQTEAQEVLSYFNFMLNAMGDTVLSPREKDVIVNESYQKLFRDDKVQIEDDLIAGRDAVTNKDVQAYLKDVNFFFKQVHFDYQILDIRSLVNEQGQPYLKIHCNRTLKGMPVDADTLIEQRQERYIEVLVNEEHKDLKVVSVYTHKINEQEAQMTWWNELPLNWKEYLGHNISFDEEYKWSDVMHVEPKQLVFKSTFAMAQDTSFSFPTFDTLVFYNDSMQKAYNQMVQQGLSQILSIQSLDLSKETTLQDIEPLSQLSHLQSLILSNTMVWDITPLRNLLKLSVLDISHTFVTDLLPLAFSTSLQQLNISHTPVADLSTLDNLQALQMLDISHTAIDSLPANLSWKALINLNMSFSKIHNINILQYFTHLQRLTADACPLSSIEVLSTLKPLQFLSLNNTFIDSLQALKPLDSLRVLHIDATAIHSLQALDAKPSLQKIYCDSTAISKTDILTFSRDNPHVLVVWESNTIAQWYVGLSQAWREVLQKEVGFTLNEQVNKEQLHSLSKIERIDISNNKDITDVKALSVLYHLKTFTAHHSALRTIDGLVDLENLQNVDVSYTDVQSITPLLHARQLKTLSINHSQVNDLSPLGKLLTLERLHANACPIQTLNPLQNLPQLNYVEIEDCAQLPKEDLLSFLKNKPQVQVLYQSKEAMQWWQALSADWQALFRQQQHWKEEPTTEDLHELLRLPMLKISRQTSLQSFVPLHAFVLLEDLSIHYCELNNVSDLLNIKTLKKLDISNNPIQKLEGITNLTELQQLNISNTPVNRLDALSTLFNLKVLDISGTLVKRLKPLRDLENLNFLSASNCPVKSLYAIAKLPLNKLKVFNTRISQKKINNYKNTHPHCQVEFY